MIEPNKEAIRAKIVEYMRAKNLGVEQLGAVLPECYSYLVREGVVEDRGPLSFKKFRRAYHEQSILSDIRNFFFD